MWFLCHCSGWIQWEVNHLCFPPSHHPLVVDSIVWLTASLANECHESCLCGIGVQSRGGGRGSCRWGRNPAEAAAADLTAVESDPLLLSTLRKRSCDYDDYNGEEWKVRQLRLKSPTAEIRTGLKHVRSFWSQLQISAFCGCSAVKLRESLSSRTDWKTRGPENYTDVG